MSEMLYLFSTDGGYKTLKDMKSFLHIINTAIYIVIFSIIAGALFNYLRPDTYSYDYADYRPPVITSQDDKDIQIVEPCEPIPLFLEDAYEGFFLTGKAVFVDTRLEKDYRKNRVPGAINIPLDRTASVFNRMEEGLPKDQIYIFYCDDGCPSGEETAWFFCQRGYQDGKIFFFQDHFERWIELGYPVEE